MSFQQNVGFAWVHDFTQEEKDVDDQCVCHVCKYERNTSSSNKKKKQWAKRKKYHCDVYLSLPLEEKASIDKKIEDSETQSCRDIERFASRDKQPAFPMNGWRCCRYPLFD